VVSGRVSRDGGVRAAAALGGDPDDVARRVLDVASLAVHAVLRVDLQPVRLVVILDELVDAGRAVAALRPGVAGQVEVDRHGSVLERQVRGLVLFVVGVADEHRAEPVEGELAVGLGIGDLRHRGSRLQMQVIGLLAVDRPRRALHAQLGQQPLLDARHQRADRVALLEPLLEVARLLQLGMQPALLERRRVGRQFVVGAAGLQRVERGFGGQHAGLDRGVAALDARSVQRASLAADQRTAREHQLGQAQQAARGDGAGAVADALAAFEVGADGRVGLPALHLLERTQPRVLVVQPGDEAERDPVAFEVVQKAAAIGVARHRPAGGVHHQPGLRLRRIDLPQFLDAQRVALRIAAGVELEALDQLPAEVAARAFGEHGVLARQLHAELEAVVRLAVAADADVAGGHAAHRAAFVVQHLGGAEAGEDLDAQCLGLLAQPLRQRAQADDVVAVVVEAVGHQPGGCLLRAGLAQEQHLVGADWLMQRRAALLPVGEQLGQRTRVHHGAAQRVGAGLAALFEHDHRQLGAGRGGPLLEPDRRGQAGRAAADDHDVVVHRLARAVLIEQLLRCHERRSVVSRG